MMDSEEVILPSQPARSTLTILARDIRSSPIVTKVRVDGELIGKEEDGWEEERGDGDNSINIDSSNEDMIKEDEKYSEIREQFISYIHILYYSISINEKLDILNNIIELNRLYPYINYIKYEIEDNIDNNNILIIFYKNLRLLLVDNDTNIRIQTLRLIRYCLYNNEAYHIMFNLLNYDIFLSRSLERDTKYLWERMQALKIIRHILNNNPLYLTRSLVISIIAIAENNDDDFKRVCVDTLREMLLINTELVASCNGIKVIMEAILDPELSDMTTTLTLTILVILDQESKRKYIRPYLDIQCLLTVFTDTDTDSDVKEHKINSAKQALLTMMRSWTGILYLASDPQGLRSLIEFLALPKTVKGSGWAINAIFNFLFNLFDVISSNSRIANIDINTPTNLLYNYVVMVLIALIDCGLVEILTKLSVASDGYSDNAKRLLTEIFALCADLLPNDLCSKLHTLKEAISVCSAFNNKDHSIRIKSAAFLNELCRDESVSVVKSLNIPVSSPGGLGNRSATPSFSISPTNASVVLNNNRANPSKLTKPKNFHQLPVRGICAEQLALQSDPRLVARSSGTRKDDIASLIAGQLIDVKRKGWFLKNLKSQFVTHVEEYTFQNMLKLTNVLVTKVPSEWNINACLDLVEGPLQDPIYLSSVLKTKFIKRLMSHLCVEHKGKVSLSEMKWAAHSFNFIRLYAKLFELMLRSEEGADYIYFKDGCNWLVSNCLLQLKREVSLKKDNIETTLCFNYFELLGVMSSHPNGLYYFNKFDLWKLLIQIADFESCNVYSRLIASNLDCRSELNKKGENGVEISKARHVLGVYIMVGSIQLRRYIISHLRMILRVNKDREFMKWSFELLVSQLEGEFKLAIEAVNILSEICVEKESLDTLVALKPSFTLVGKFADSLKIRMLCTLDGFNLLANTGFIESQLNLWSNYGNVSYVEHLEKTLVDALFSTKPKPENNSRNRGISFATKDFLNNFPKINNADSTFLTEKENLYYFDRVHRMPWAITIELEYANGKSATVRTDTYVVTIPKSALQSIQIGSSTFEEVLKIQAEQMSGVSFAEDELITLVVGSVVDWFKHQRSILIEPTVSIKAVLSLGNEDSFENASDQPAIFKPSFRTQIIDICNGGDESKTSLFDFIAGDGHSFCIREKDPNVDLNDDDEEEELADYGETKPPKKENIKKDAAYWLMERYRPNDYIDGFTVEEDGEETQKLAQQNFSNPTSPFSLSRMFSKGKKAKTPISQSYEIRPERSRTTSMYVDPSLYCDVYFNTIAIPIPVSTASYPRVPLQPHLYGDLAKTSQGCKLISKGNYISDFLKTLDDPNIDSIKKRSVLWALGHIGGSDSGFALLQDSKIIDKILYLSKSCSTISIRGTCFYVIGILSRSRRCREYLASVHWASPNFTQLGISVPKDLSSFLTIKDCKFAGSWALDPNNYFGSICPANNLPTPSNLSISKINRFVSKMCNGVDHITIACPPRKVFFCDENDSQDVEEAPATIMVPSEEIKLRLSYLEGLVLNHVSNLSNHVSQKDSHAALVSLRTKHSALFNSPKLFFEVVRLLVCNSFRLSARRFLLYDIFENVEFSMATLDVFNEKLLPPL